MTVSTRSRLPPLHGDDFRHYYRALEHLMCAPNAKSRTQAPITNFARGAQSKKAGVPRRAPLCTGKSGDRQRSSPPKSASGRTVAPSMRTALACPARPDIHRSMRAASRSAFDPRLRPGNSCRRGPPPARAGCRCGFCRDLVEDRLHSSVSYHWMVGNCRSMHSTTQPRSDQATSGCSSWACHAFQARSRQAAPPGSS